ncbi:hypothetical protein C8F04DRAFT_1265817 [Mycena alexandri]|uniref:Uncharacterized protein n=1 Tax=Mycena alexandri TaxID=1745969 RepID=A0AAD6SN06_9AGAR|nr:hypothetical protein C8F04DRAFT_1265817 [Mycena alexandri]
MSDRARYTCYACNNPDPEWTSKSIVAEESTARTVNSQNGVEWLGYSNKNIFDGKSAFKLTQAFGESIWDVGFVITQVENWVGRDQVVLAACALCFEDVPNTKLVAACGRTGVRIQPHLLISEG